MIPIAWIFLLGAAAAPGSSPASAAAQQRRAPAPAQAAPRPAAQIFTGKVTAVPRGDTLRVLRNDRPVVVRLWGVTTPGPGQPFGPQARQFTATSVLGQNVRVEVRRSTGGGGTLLADVFVPTSASAAAGAASAAPGGAGPAIGPATSGNLDPTGTQRDLPRGLPGSQIETPAPSPAATEQNLAQALLLAGLARWDRAAARTETGLADREAEARKDGRGIWSGRSRPDAQRRR
jgi:endonuclease YncB( thermonuclease family)